MKKFREKRKRQKSILSAIEELDDGYGCYAINIVREIDEDSDWKNELKMIHDLWELKDRGFVDFLQTHEQGFDITRNIRLTLKGRKKWFLYRDDITSVSAIVAAIASVIAIILTFLN